MRNLFLLLFSVFIVLGVGAIGRESLNIEKSEFKKSTKETESIVITSDLGSKIETPLILHEADSNFTIRLLIHFIDEPKREKLKGVNSFIKIFPDRNSDKLAYLKRTSRKLRIDKEIEIGWSFKMS